MMLSGFVSAFCSAHILRNTFVYSALWILRCFVTQNTISRVVPILCIPTLTWRRRQLLPNYLVDDRWNRVVESAPKNN